LIRAVALTPSAETNPEDRRGRVRAARVTDEMKVAAAQAIASVLSRKDLHEESIIPSVFNKKVAPAVAREVVRAAQQGGFARRRRRPAH
jgi:malate dehydrogenase (oxaloacetate-decarboxylating)